MGGMIVWLTVHHYVMLLLLVAGGAVLSARRQRCPRAAGLALPGVALLLLIPGYFVGSGLTANRLPQAVSYAMRDAFNFSNGFVHVAGLALLAVAAITDRGRRPS